MKFTIAQILTITGDKVLCSVEDIYGILDFMTGDKLYTHQLLRASDECTPELIRQHPWLAEIDCSSVTPANYEEFLQQQIEKYGEWHEVHPVPSGVHEVKDPLVELREMFPNKPIIVVDSDTKVKVIPSENDNKSSS